MNTQDDAAGQVFSIPDLYGPSAWLLNVQDSPGILFSTLKLDNLDTELPDVVRQRHDEETPYFSIPDFSLGIPGAGEQPTSQVPQGVTDVPLVVEDIDIWALPENGSIQSINHQSWEPFEDAAHSSEHTPYITDAGSLIFEAALRDPGDCLHLDNSGHVVVDTHLYAASISALGLGRSSVLFTWDDQNRSFKPTFSDMRITGYTAETLNSLLLMFMDCGNTTRALRSFVKKSYVTRKSPCQIALAEAVSTLLTIIQSSLSDSCSHYQSLLKLQTSFKPAHTVLDCFHRIVKKTFHTREDESMLSTIFEEVQAQEYRIDSLNAILVEILSRASRPWLEFVSEWIGLRREEGIPITKEGQGKGFVQVSDKEWLDEQGIEMQERDFVLDYDKVPSFIAPEDARSMFEVGKSLQFLKAHHPDHPITRADIVTSAKPPSFEWSFTWQDIVAVEAKALQYEQNLTDAIQKYSGGSSGVDKYGERLEATVFKWDFFGKPEIEIHGHIMSSIDTFNLPLQEDAASDQLSLAIRAFLSSSLEADGINNSMFSPPISLTPSLSFNPLLSSQARIVNRTCMRLFFDTHNLRDHLSLQRNFHLMGNGLFSTRLSHALFDPELESAERHRGIARSGGTMGIRLGGRETWPPASSELRLALMGILTESYVSKQPLDQALSGSSPLERAIPGDLSFAVRDMSEQEIEKCMDPDSIEALDFLRLSYKPPPPLETVITPMILFKYDQLFKLLLRLLRMLYVTSDLFRETSAGNLRSESMDPVAQRFRIEAQHFIFSISSYFFDTGIESTWRIFDRKLDEIEARIHSNDDNTLLGQDDGLDRLRYYHERILDRIMFSLLLRKRQQPVMRLLEEIFTMILHFSKLTKDLARDDRPDTESGETVRDLYARFRKKVGIFITVCRGLSEKKGYGDRKVVHQMSSGQAGLFEEDDLVEENTIVQLLGKLEISGYYSKTIKT